MTNTDCQATEECSLNQCRARCLADTDCPTDSACGTDGLCSIPVGTPCGSTIGGLGLCGFDPCTDVDANLTTVEAYCTRFCSDSTGCPDGYVCQSSECRRN